MKIIYQIEVLPSFSQNNIEKISLSNIQPEKIFSNLIIK
jgi:hypothetical protein